MEISFAKKLMSKWFGIKIAKTTSGTIL